MRSCFLRVVKSGLSSDVSADETEKCRTNHIGFSLIKAVTGFAKLHLTTAIGGVRCDEFLLRQAAWNRQNRYLPEI